MIASALTTNHWRRARGIVATTEWCFSVRCYLLPLRWRLSCLFSSLVAFVSFQLRCFLTHTHTSQTHFIVHKILLIAGVCASVVLPLSFYWRYCVAFISIAIAKALARAAQNNSHCNNDSNNNNSNSEHPQPPQSYRQTVLASAFALAFAVAALATAATAAATSSSSRSATQKEKPSNLYNYLLARHTL